MARTGLRGQRARPDGRVSLRGALLVALVAAALAQGGCGVGIGMVVDTAEIGPMVGSFSDVPAGKLEARVAVVAPTVTIYDKSGLILAALGNASAAVSARREAARSAVARGARSGDRFSYRYRVHAPSPGLLTSFTYSWSSPETIGLRLAGGDTYKDVTPTEASFSIFDVRLSLWQPTIVRDLTGTLQVGARARSYTLIAPSQGTGAIPYEVDGFAFGIPVSFRLDYHGLSVIRPWVRGVYDPVQSLLNTMLREKDTQQAAAWQLQGGVDVPIFHWLSLASWLGVERGSIDAGKHDVHAVSAQVRLVAMFGR